MRVAFFLALALLLDQYAFGQVSLPSEFKIRAGRLGKIEATSKAPVKWINLHDGLDLVADSSGRWAFVLGNTPGVYKIAAFGCGEGGPEEPAYCSVRVEGPDPAPPGPRPAPSFADPAKATCRLRFGSSGCTATIIGPRREDGYWSALTASHCTGPIGNVGQITLQDGRIFNCAVTARETVVDISWLRIDAANLETLPYAVLATEAPAVGTKVWHQGYGIDKPGNRESGVVSAAADSNGQIQFQLSVSSGDSGSGIFRQDTGDLVGVVCCTSAKGSKVTMWGGGSIPAAKIKKSDTRIRPILFFPPEEQLHPIDIPLRPAQGGESSTFNWLKQKLDFFQQVAK